jgi:hypothetical protein
MGHEGEDRPGEDQTFREGFGVDVGRMRTLGTGISPYNGLAILSTVATVPQSQQLTVALTNQNSPNLTSFVTFGTPLGTLKKQPPTPTGPEQLNSMLIPS